MISLQDVLLGARLLVTLAPFLREPIGLAEARAVLRRRLEQRERDFLALVRDAVYASPASPYRTLLALAGCEQGDLGCLEPAHADDVHLFHDCHALIQPGDGGVRPELPAGALLVSTLRRTAPVILLNVSMGDEAVVEERRCGCALEGLGWRVHLHTIRSYEKLTAGGMTFLDGDIIPVLEEWLPARFGGGPTDYQLVEDSSAEGDARVRLLVHPSVGPLDPPVIAEAFLTRIGAGPWRRAGDGARLAGCAAPPGRAASSHHGGVGQDPSPPHRGQASPSTRALTAEMLSGAHRIGGMQTGAPIWGGCVNAGRRQGWP